MLGQKQAKSQKSWNNFADKKLKLPERKPHVRSHLSFRGVKRRRNPAGAQTDVCFRPRRLPRFRSQWQGGGYAVRLDPSASSGWREKERKDRLWRLIPPQCRLSNQYLPTSPSSVKSKTSATVMRLCMPGRLLPFRQEAILLRDMPVSLTRRYSDIFFSVRTFENCSQNGNAGWCGVYCASISSNAKW